MVIGAAQRESVPDRGARFLSPRYCYVNRVKFEVAGSAAQFCPSALGFDTRAKIILVVRKKKLHTSTPGQHEVRFLEDLGSIKLALFPARYTTTLQATRSSGDIQVRP